MSTSKISLSLQLAEAVQATVGQYVGVKFDYYGAGTLADGHVWQSASGRYHIYNYPDKGFQFRANKHDMYIPFIVQLCICEEAVVVYSYPPLAGVTIQDETHTYNTEAQLDKLCKYVQQLLRIWAVQDNEAFPGWKPDI